MKTGRNQPCPCGSGKKYKKCCMARAATPSQAFYYRRLSEAHDRLVKRLMKHAERTFGEDSVHQAMQEFLLWPETDEQISEDVLDRVAPLFWPWYLFNWQQDSVAEEAKPTGSRGRTAAELYAEKQGAKLDTLERRLIEAINRKPYSFWEVLSVDQGKGMGLKDALTGTPIAVEERSGSQYVQIGDLLFGRAVSVDGVGMLIGLAPTLIPPGRKADIIRLRKRLQKGSPPITDDTLSNWALEIREFFFSIDRALHTAPQLRNTDGNELEFHKLIYEVSSAEVAFQKLCALCATLTPEEICADGEIDEKGRIMRVEFPWDRQGHNMISAMPNTVLGRIVINGQRLTAEVNSAERAATLRREIDTRLGTEGRLRADEIQNLDMMMRRQADGAAEKEESPEQQELLQHPEIQAQVAEMFSRHWEGWVDQPIPALEGKSPREAVKTAEGREAVEALLKDNERNPGEDAFTAELNRKGAQRVREILGLT